MGLREARGRYAVFLDSDDMLFPWALAVYKEAIERFEEPALLMAGFQRFRDETELRAVSPAPLNAEVWDDYLQPAARICFLRNRVGSFCRVYSLSMNYLL
jgi:hypothetical protein